MSDDDDTLQSILLFGACIVFCIICFVMITLFMIWYSGNPIFGIFRQPVELGGDCVAHTDCKDWGPGATQVACCKGKCTTKQVDWAGVGYCPEDCVGTAGGQPGTCGNNSVPGAEIGQPCSLHTDCKGWGPGATQNACCNGKCTQKQKDWANVGYCPHECVGTFGGKPGTCGRTSSTPSTPSGPPPPSGPRPIGSPCSLHTDCAGWGAGTTAVACCRGRCTRKKKDWAGVGYCPHECVGSFGGKPGSC